MANLIERDALKNHLYRAQAEAFKHSAGYVAGAIQSFIDLLDKQPTIEAEPVRHGRWIEVTKHRDENGTILTDYECSECCAMVKDSYPEEIENERFCYNCGARMDATDTNVGGKGDEEMDLSPLDFLAAEYDRKHPQGIRFVDCMEGADDGACKKV